MERSKHFKVVAAFCAALISICSTGYGRVIYVDDDATAPGDGSSWQTAYKFLQDALGDAEDSEKPVEIRVAQGIYRPDRSSLYPEGSRDRMASFHLLNGVTLRGGYGGVHAPDPDTCDIGAYTTVLSGDLHGDDLVGLSDMRTDNSYHVIWADRIDRTTVLTGVTIASGCADGWPSSGIDVMPWDRVSAPVPPPRPDHIFDGGGLYITGGSLTVANCIFKGNRAGGRGGAVYNLCGRPTMVDCRFEENSSESGGGAVFSSNFSEFVFQNCDFRNNYARTGGGAVYSVGSNTVFTACTFTANCVFSVGGWPVRGGAIVCTGSDLALRGCVMQGNSASAGGALFCTDSNLKLENCTFVDNRAKMGEAIGCTGRSDMKNTVSLANCILWGASEQIWKDDVVAPLAVSYCDIAGGWPGEGNIDSDPRFIHPGYWDLNDTPDDPSDDSFVEGDYHLKSQAGRWDPAGEKWVIDDMTSLCIDAGNPGSPVGDEPEPNGGRVNMGAYGGTAQASMSPQVGPTAGLWSEPLPLSEINLDTAEEWSPVLSADGLTLYFGRVRGPDSYFGRIFQATRQLPVPYSRFVPVTELTGALNRSVEHVICPWISADGLRMYYTHQVGSVFRLMVSERPAGSTLWPVGREIRELNQLDSRLHTCRLTVDELTIYFAGPDQQGAAAEYDIWMATRTDRQAPFGEPVNAVWLNSPANDQHATPSADGLSLYLASKRSGRYQLFRSTWEDLDGSFGPPVHMALFDTPNGHSMFPCLSPDGTEFYFVRQIGEDRSARDIWVSYRLD